MNETWEDGKKANFGPNFGPFTPNLGPKLFFVILAALVVRHCSKLSS